MTLNRPKPVMGVYDEPFWQHVKNREVRLQRCSNGHFCFPPGPCCPRCGAHELEWHQVSGRARLCSWTTFHRQYFPEMPAPYIVVSAELEEGPLLVADFIGNEEDLALDRPLHLVFEDCRFGDLDWVIYRWSPTNSAK